MCVRVTMPVPVCVYVHVCACVCMCVCVFFYNVSTVDKWRVVLKGETPDYINASSINVSSSTNNTLESTLHKYQISHTHRITFFCYSLSLAGLQVPESLYHHPGTHVIHSQGFLEDGS